MGAISLVDKDGLRCADIVDPHKLASIPELSTLHELLQRIARFMRAGRSISSGGGTQAGGFRAHFRIVPHGRHSTPGTMEWGHLDSVCSLRVASAAKRLYASDPQNTMLAARFIMSLEVRNTTNVLIPTAGVMLKAMALAPCAPLAMGIVSRGHVVGQQPLALHTGATVMLDGSCKPRVMQIVFDTMLADVPAMVACLAKMRLRDVVAMPECRDEISQLVDVVQAAMRLGE